MALDVSIPAAGGQRYVGQSIKRVEDPRLLAGQARFVDDLTLPGMVHASFVRSPHAHARIVSIDTSAAEAVDGVVAVFTGADFADLLPFVPNGIMREELLAPEHRVMPADKARFVGEAVAVVVATTPYIAEDGRDLVDVEWEPLPVVVDPEAALEPGAPLLHESLGTNNIAHLVNSAGDVDGAFAQADRVFTKRFVHAGSTGAPIGTRGIVAEYDQRGGGHLTIYPTSQMPHLLRLFIAPTLGMPEGRVTIKTPDVGGAFGLTCTVFPEDALVPAAARKVGRPVKWIEDRYENLAVASHSKRMLCEMEIAADDDGTFRGFRARIVADAGAYSALPFTSLADSLCAGEMMPSVYDVDAVAYTADNPMTNKCHLGPIRGVGWAPAQVVRETLIDDVARGLNIDPVELRLRNMIGSEPRTNAFGARYDGGSYKESLEKARDAIGYEAFRERQRAARADGRYLGVGFSPFVEPTGWAAKAANAGGMPGGYFDTASVTMEPDGSVTVTTGNHSHGQGHETTFAQVAADQLGVPIEKIRVITNADTDSAAWGMGTYASRSGVLGTGSITSAAGELRERLLGLAGTMLEASAADIELRDDQAVVKGAPARAVSIGEVAIFGYFGGPARTSDVQVHGLSTNSGYDSEETYANGCAAAIVEVDVDTGLVTIERFVGVEDCGVQLNPMIVHGQVSGAVAYGIGIALLEECVYDDHGEFVSGSLLNYLYPTTAEVPMLELHSIETPSSCTGGVKGVGEAGTISTPPAILNAIADALSPFDVKIERAPATPMYIRELLREPGGAGE